MRKIEEQIAEMEERVKIATRLARLEKYEAIGTVEEFKALKEKNEPKKVEYQDEEKERLVKSDEDCADCLCRLCARNSCNDSYNIQLEGGYANCSCNCNIGYKLIEAEEYCPNFIPDEDWL